MDDIQKPDGFQVKDIQSKEEFRQATQPEAPKKKKLGLIFLFTKKNLPKTLITILAIVVLLAAVAVIWGRHSFSKAKVNIEIDAPRDIASGDEITLVIKYENNNRVSLGDASLVINYPSGTFSIDGKEIHQDSKELGLILRKSKGEESFKVRFVGEKGDIKNLTAKLNYRPQNINSRFENSSSSRIEINLVLIGVNIEGSEKTISGQEVEYLIEYENKTDDDFLNLKLELEYSEDFKFEETDNVWLIDLLKAGQKEVINLKGVLIGDDGENKILKATIGKMENNIFLQYNQSEHVTQISPSPLLLILSIEGIDQECNINPGQKIKYKIEFKNNTDIALRELILKVYFEDGVFDFKVVDLGDIGFFDSAKNTITWSGAEVQSLNILEPNQSGQVSFLAEIQDFLPIFNYNDKNFQAKIFAEIETLTIPAKFSVSELKTEKDLFCKINSVLDLNTRVYYYELSQGIINIGPIPPKVDQLTTYTVHWQIINTSNDLENVKVSAYLPQGIIWQNNSINKISDSNLIYNERTKEIIWQVNNVPAGIGLTLPAYEIIFQIGIRPSINQVGQTPTLINESSIEGKDTFTQKTLKDFTPEVTTTLPDDSRVSSNQGRVQE